MKECCNINDVINDFHEEVLNYVYTKINNRADAEDLFQEIMIKILRAHSDNKEVRNLKNWIYTISNNSIIDYYRKNKIPIEELDEFPEDDSKDVHILDIREYVVPMIKLLDDKYSEILLLSDIEQISQKEISERLNIGLSATKSRVQRARKLLREMFSECCIMELDKNGVIISCHIKFSCTPLKNIENQ